MSEEVPNWMRNLAASCSLPGPFNGLDSVADERSTTRSDTMLEEEMVDCNGR